MRRFIPLHVHSHFSLLEGVDSPVALVERAAACSYPALALTDTNNLYGAVPFVEAARQRGIRPILGACLRHAGQRCTVLIGEPSGYRSLCRILSEIHLGAPARPLLEILAEYGAGLHALINDLAFLQRYLVLSTQYPGLGAGSTEWPKLWLELIRPGRSATQERQLLEEGQRLGLKPVASVAAHFATPESYDTFRLITAVRQGELWEQTLAQPTHGNGWAESITPAHHLADFEIVYQRFRDVPEALVNTERLADQCRSDVLPRGIVLPPAQVPRAHDAPGYLRLLCERGLRRRIDNQVSYRDRMEEELHLIQQRDLAGYFLVVRGIAREARRRGYSMALRGSAGNSLVCFLLGITNVDPLRFDLPLERFLHPGRPDLPDIDLDFDWKVRDEIIAWVFERYGHAHTAMISSHLYLQPASAFREAGKVHGLSNEQITRLLESLSSRVGGLLSDGATGRRGDGAKQSRGEEALLGSSSPLCDGRGEGQGGADNMNPSPRHPLTPSPPHSLAPPKNFPLEPSRWPRLLADARRLLGRPHHLSIHPGGVVITPGPIADYVPLQRAAKGIVITQFEKEAIEHIGLVKIDLLGNRALATVDAAIGYRLSAIGHRPTAADCLAMKSLLLAESRKPRAESRALELLQRGDTLGVNQLESPAMRHLLIQMQPRGLMDVIQSLALIRPGAASIGCKELFVRRRRGLEPVTHLHPCLEPVLRDTHGLMLYEDDALRVVQVLTGVSPPEADRLRKQITKCQSEDEAVAISKTFLDACQRNGIPRAAASEIWVQLAKFNSYSFCKSHAVSYGLIAWQAVQLKANHPLGFWVAALNNNQGMYPRRVYVEAAKRMGIPFLLPCVNRSERDFSIERPAECVLSPEGAAVNSQGREPLEGAIRTGLGVIRTLDEDTQEAILEDRSRRGPFASLADFRRRVPTGPEALAILIQVGAFDFTGQSRAELMLEAELERFRVSSLKFREKTREAEVLPFDNLIRNSKLETRNWSPSDYSQARRWKEEWDLLGFLVGPPLMTLFRPYLPHNLDDSRCLRERIGKRIRLAGLVATSRHTPTKRGEGMQFITLEDEWGLVELTLFPGNCRPVAYLTMGPYIAEGVVEEQYGVVTVTARRFEETRRNTGQSERI